MHSCRPTRWVLLCAFSCLCLPANRAVAQVHYENGQPWSQTAGEGPDAEVPGWYYHLGLTGIRAELTAEAPKALLVRHVFAGTPASGKVAVGDQIVGVGGQRFRKPHQNGYGMEVFGAAGPIGELAAELESCQGKSGKGKLRLLIARKEQKPMEVELDIGTSYGSYAPTFPENCPKSEKIRSELLAYLLKHQGEDGSFGDPVHNTFASLALMSSGEPEHLRAVERNLRHLCESLGSSTKANRDGLMNWTYTGTAITLAEYYLLTKQEWALPELNKLKLLLEDGQYLDMSQINPSVKQSHPDSYPKGPMASHGGWGHNPGFEGYGPIAMITAQGALSFALMERCGLTIDRKRLDAAYAFLKRGTGPNGYLWYGDSPGGGPDDWADMGRTGASAIANFLDPEAKSQTRHLARDHTDVIGKHPQSFPDTHASPAMGMGYTALGASIDPKNFRKLMDANRWWFTMAQCNDGTFYYQPNRDNGGYGADSRMTASCVVAFIYSIPKHALVVTGREAAKGRTTRQQAPQPK